MEKICEKCCELHKNPINCVLHVIAAIVVIYSLWINSTGGILIGILIAIIGHIIQAAANNNTKVKKRKR